MRASKGMPVLTLATRVPSVTWHGTRKPVLFTYMQLHARGLARSKCAHMQAYQVSGACDGHDALRFPRQRLACLQRVL